MRPLLCIFCPRDNAVFYDIVQQFPYDKLYIKYYPLLEARTLARNFFLSYEKFDYFMILTDDLITRIEVFEKLIEDEKQHSHKIISGWCNGNITFGQYDTDFSFSLPPDPPATGTYEGYKFVPITDILKIRKQYGDIVKVKHQGFNPSLIHRSIIEKIPFRVSGGCCSDSCFSIDLDAAGIDQYIDLD
ncbi:MAG: hypothetical protein WB511_01610, partial [Nitrososphaeraceae archaeon]